MTPWLAVADLVRPDANVRCPCGDVLTLHTHSDEGQHGQSVSQGTERGKAISERRCRTCGLALTVQVWL
ncbi:hypothetical protein AB0F72_08405 [Actinoplanes sp. NPDC023936]|uniref:hypothetical protein n=1 Tax=Actinoplanes sp. NPDC023936 TaxID=3154910 RepID=UPI00340228B0